MINITNEDNMLLMARYPDNYFDLAIVDPPYGIGVAKMAYTQEKNRSAKQKNGNLLNVKKQKYKKSDWDNKPPTKEYFNELKRVSKEQIIWGINYMPYNFVGGRIVWDKCTPEGVSFSDCEIAYCSLHNGIRLFTYLWAGMFQGKSLTEPTTQQGNKLLNEKRIHPTHKPVRLYKWILSKYAKKGFKILDTHLGGGSIAVACCDLGYDLTACEIDKEYFNDSMKRINAVINQTKLDL